GQHQPPAAHVMTGDVADRADAPIPIAVIRGDGIGPEIVDAALEVMDAAMGPNADALVYTEIDAGAATFQRSGVNMSDADFAALRTGEFAALLKGPTGLPSVRLADGTEPGLLGGLLRTGLDTYANVRPIFDIGVPGPLRTDH